MTPPPINPTLQLSPNEMRSLGYRVIDLIIAHYTGLQEKPVTRVSMRAALEKRLREPIPEHGMNPHDALDIVMEDVFTHMMHSDHPRFLAFVPTPSNFVSAMADALVAGFDPFAGTWLESSGPAQIELITIDWMRGIFGLPDTAGGLFVSGGSMANLTALAAARHTMLEDRMEGAVIYGSDQTHSSVLRALRVLGFQREQWRAIPSDDRFRLSIPALRDAIRADRSTGKRPFCVVANVGTTNTGAVDPLPELADLCDWEGLWLHADGAFGAAAILAEQGRLLLRGIEHVDSLVIDPHKWLFQPYEIGCVLVRDRHLLRETFHILPEYLQDTNRSTEEINFCDYGIQLTRSFRALKLWLSLKTFGLESFRAAVTHGFALAEYAEAVLRARPHWAILTPAQMGVLTFRHAPDGVADEELDAINRRLVEAMIADGCALVVSTILRGRTVLRFCTINPRTTEDDLRKTIHTLETLVRRI